MKITSNPLTYQLPNLPRKEIIKKEDTPKNIQTPKKQTDEYIPSKPNNSGIYKKPSYQAHTMTIEKLKAESDRAHEQLRNLVKQMLEKQGLTFQDAFIGGKEIVVDEDTRLAAQAAISDEGPLSAEKVSDRIVDFAKAISGGDKNKFNLLKGAIEDGFNAAKSALGGTLPEVSQKTFDLVMEKLDRWKEEE